MSNNVVNFAEYKAKKEKAKAPTSTRVVQDMRDSLDNKQVMQRYGIKAPKISTEERMERIRKSIKKVNELMTQLREENTK